MFSLYKYNQAGHMKVIREEGREEGEEIIISLNTWLFENDRADDVKKSTLDSKYRKSLLEEYEKAHKNSNKE